MILLIIGIIAIFLIGLSLIIINDLEKRICNTMSYIEIHKRGNGFLELNEWQTRDLLKILRGE